MQVQGRGHTLTHSLSVKDMLVLNEFVQLHCENSMFNKVSSNAVAQIGLMTCSAVEQNMQGQQCKSFFYSGGAGNVSAVRKLIYTHTCSLDFFTD